MNCLTILIKIKEFSIEKGEIPFDNFICIFKNNHFEGRISLMQYKYQYVNHEIKDIISDIYYKINVIDFTSNKLIGRSEYCISYNKINSLCVGTSINFSNKIKLSINYNSQKASLYLTIFSEIIKYNKIPFTIRQNSEINDKININNNTNKLIYNHNKLNKNRNYIKQINNKNKKNPFESIKIKKINISRKKVDNLNKYNENNCILSSRSLKKYNKNRVSNKNKLEIVYKREFGSPSLLFTEEDKKNINLNMHNICVQNYYAITSSQPPININSIIEKKNNSRNKIYTKKNLNSNRLNIKIDKEIRNDNEIKNNDFIKLKEIKNNFNKIGIKRFSTNINSEMNKNGKENRINQNLNEMIMTNYPDNSSKKNSSNIKKEIIKKSKNKTKDKDKISEKFFLNCNKSNIDKLKNYEVINNNNQFLFNKKNKITSKNKKNNQIRSIKGYSSVDKVKNKASKNNYNKLIKINNLFRNSTIDLDNDGIIKKRPFITNLYKYLSSIDNFNYNILTSTFSKNVNNKKYKLEKNSNIISPKSYTLRDNSNNNLKKRIYNSNNNLSAGIKNKNLDDDNCHIFIEENNNYNNTIDKNNYIYQKNFILFENDNRNEILNIIQSNILLIKKIRQLKKDYNLKKVKLSLIKEKYLHKLTTKNAIVQKRNINEINNYIHVNINCQINNKIITKINKIKEKENNIYEKIFDISIKNTDKYKEISKEVMQKENEKKLVYLLLGLVKNIVNHHGDITQIFNDRINKKRYLFFLLINNGIAVNNLEHFYTKLRKNDKLNEINKKYKCKEIKEEIEEEKEENEEEENKLNISIIYKKDNILDKILIIDFPNKYKHITDKTFVKTSSNEYIFNNEIKVFAYYKDDKVFLQIEKENESIYDSYDNECSLDEFISKYTKNKDKLIVNRKNIYLSPVKIKSKKNFCSQKLKKSNYNNFIEILERGGVKRKKLKKKNLCFEKHSRNHKMNEIKLVQADFKKIFLNDKILLSNESIINDSNNTKEENNENKPNENISNEIIKCNNKEI